MVRPRRTTPLSHHHSPTQPPKQSVETHTAWFLIPPPDYPGINWTHFPDGARDVEADEQGFRGFVVEFHNLISDVVVQDGHQGACLTHTATRIYSFSLFRRV